MISSAASERLGHGLAVAAVWIGTRAFMVSQLGYFRPGTEIRYEDVMAYANWSDQLADGRMPVDLGWQYPPGAAFIFMLPRLLPIEYGPTFVALLLLFDLLATIALLSIGRREQTNIGVWTWLLVIPVLGRLPLLRFDLVPTSIALLALAIGAASRDRLFGAVVAVGAAVKAWPVLLMLSVPAMRRAWVAAVSAVATGLFILLTSWVAFGNGLRFLGNHAGRGLEIEAVAATPWYILQAVFGSAVKTINRNGCVEINSPLADVVAQVLLIAMALFGVALAVWWWAWQRSNAPKTASVGRDATFTALLLYVVLSEVLSPQYLIWLVGLGAAALASTASLIRRPVILVLAATILTGALLAVWGDLVNNGSRGAYILTLRNIALLIAALDAALIMARLVWPERAKLAPKRPPLSNEVSK